MLPGTGCKAKKRILDSHAGMKVADRIAFAVPFGDIKKLQPQVFAQGVGIQPEPTVFRCRAALTCRVPPIPKRLEGLGCMDLSNSKPASPGMAALENARILSGLPGRFESADHR